MKRIDYLIIYWTIESLHFLNILLFKNILEFPKYIKTYAINESPSNLVLS